MGGYQSPLLTAATSLGRHNNDAPPGDHRDRDKNVHIYNTTSIANERQEMP